MKYDIPILLALSQNASIDIGKFSVHALENNLLSRRKTNANVLTERSVNRSRVASSFSAAHSEESPFTSGVPVRYPCRQPHNAPNGNLAQTDAGFARFLKEHASPKHHRVTAGGRIVPMNTETPAPEFKLQVKSQEDDNSVECPESSAMTGRSHSSGAQATSARDTHESVNITTTAIPSISGTLPSAATSLPSCDGSGIPNRIPGLQQTFQQTMTMLPSSLTQSHLPLGLNSPESSQPGQMAQECLTFMPNYAAYSIAADQVTWIPNNNQTLAVQRASTPFMTATSQQPMTGSLSSFGMPAASIPGILPSGTSLKLPSGASFYSLAGVGANPVVSQTFPAVSPSLPIPATAHDSATHKSLQDANRQHETLSVQLANIDRYMALHSWDLDSNSKKTLVEQRMGLVRELDATRLYKEQLASSLGQQTFAPADVKTAYAPGLQPVSAQSRPGDPSNSANLQTVSWLPSLTASNMPPVWTPTTIPAPFTSMSPTNESFNTTLPYQFPTIESLTSLPTSFGYGDLRTNVSIHYGDQLPHPDWVASANQVVSSQGMQVFGTETPEGKDIRAEDDGWTTPTQSAPPEISRIYHRIEEAAKRGEPIERLLKELTAVTTKLSQSVHAGYGIFQQGAPAFDNSIGNENGPDFQTPENKVAHTGRYIEVGAGHAPQVGTQTSGHNKATKRRSHRSGESTTPSAGRGYRGSHEVEDDDDGRSCYSYLSTTDSWATIQEGDKRWLARESAKPSNEEKINHELSREGIQATFDAGNSMARSRLGNQASNMRSTVEWIQNVDHVTTAGHEQGKASLSSESSNPTTQEDGKQSSPLIFTPWRRNEEQNRSSKKACAPAVSQNINAYGFLPPFDGPGDLPESGTSQSTAANHVGHSQSGQSGAPRPNVVNSPWYSKRVRDKPQVADVRNFFQRIEEDEQDMIHKYRVGHPHA